MFFVIYVEEEGSYCTVPDTDVVYDDSVNVGDTVVFFWTKNKKQFEGIIKFVGDSYDECVAKSRELKSKEKKRMANDSFHDDKPRKSAVRCSEKILQGANKKRKQNDTSASSRNKKTRVVSHQEAAHVEVEKELLDKLKNKKVSISLLPKGRPNIHQDDSDLNNDKKDVNTSKNDLDANDNDMMAKNKVPDKSISLLDDDEVIKDTISDSEPSDSNMSSDDEDSDQENNDAKKQKLYAKLAAKLDIKTLKELISRNQDSSKVGTTKTLSDLAVHSKAVVAKPCPTPAATPKTSIHLKAETEQTSTLQSQVATTSSATSTSSLDQIIVESETKSSGSTPNKQQSASKRGSSLYQVGSLSKMVFGNRFSGEMFRPKERDSKLLDARNEIYCESTAHQHALESDGVTKAARRLMEGVFSMEALLGCSISGMPPRGKGKTAYAEDKTAIRPPLCPKGIKAILDTVLVWQDEQKTWRPRREAGYIKRSMGLRLKEIQSQNSKADH